MALLLREWNPPNVQPGMCWESMKKAIVILKSNRYNSSASCLRRLLREIQFILA